MRLDFELLVAALHVHDLIAAQVAADLLDRVDANHRRAMDLPELARVQLVEQLLDRLADQRLETQRLHPGVLVLGAEEQDVAGRDHPYRRADAGLHPAQILARLQAARPESLRQLREQVVHRVRRLRETLPQALQVSASRAGSAGFST